MKRLLIVFFTVCLLACGFAGCKSNDSGVATPVDPTEPEKKTFKKNNLTIQLPVDFTDQSDMAYAKDYTFLYANSNTGVQGVEILKSSLPETIKDIKSFVESEAEKIGVTAEQKDNLWTITYVDEITNPDPERYVCAFYEGSESYWIVKAYCREDVYEAYKADLWAYVTATTVK